MRTTAACVVFLVLAGAAIFWWQRGQIEGLRSQVARQGAALEENRDQVAELSIILSGADGRRAYSPALRAAPARAVRLTGADDEDAVMRADERRVILSQYRDTLAELNLPAATATRLEDLLADRIEAFLDAQDAARMEGFAEGSAETERAVSLAISSYDRAIAELIGPDADRRLDGLRPAPRPEGAVTAEAAAPPVAVAVYVQAPVSPDYPDSAPPPAVPADYNPAPFYYLPSAGFYAAGGPERPYPRPHPGSPRPLRPPFAPRTHRG